MFLDDKQQVAAAPVKTTMPAAAPTAAHPPVPRVDDCVCPLIEGGGGEGCCTSTSELQTRCMARNHLHGFCQRKSFRLEDPLMHMYCNGQGFQACLGKSHLEAPNDCNLMSLHLTENVCGITTSLSAMRMLKAVCMLQAGEQMTLACEGTDHDIRAAGRLKQTTPKPIIPASLIR